MRSSGAAVGSEARPGRRRRRRWVVLAVIVLAILAVLHSLKFHPGRQLVGTAVAPHGQSVITSWLENAAPAGWDSADNRIIVNRRGAGNLWGAYSILPNGRDEVCITCRTLAFPGVGARTNRGASDVSPNGRYVLLVVEKGAHPGTIGESATDPGKGAFNDIWLASSDGRQAWPLTDIPASRADGIIWPRFDRTGSQIVWAQMYAGGDLNHPLGQWAMKTARLAWRVGTPHLVDIRTYDPERGRFFEPYGFSPDDRRILFASDIHVPGGFLSPTAFNAQIWTINAAHLDDLERVSPPYHLEGMFSDYNEFAYYIPGTKDRILVGRTFDANAHGLDYWTMNADGSDARRLTFMNQPGNPQYLGYSVAGGVAFDPRDRRRFVAGISHDLGTGHLQAVFVTIG